ncbi:MAG: hypothetical protein A2X78_01210 [Gammaproteobacteria bacterium GWE2_37_16]|nr:MAG: hypothetical protein A2X78_01210 [Gammaproteobacteria bacterium GWE2_37_16]
MINLDLGGFIYIKGGFMGMFDENSFWGRKSQMLRQYHVKCWQEFFQGKILPIWNLLEEYRQYAQRMEKEMLMIRQNGTGSGVNEKRLKDLCEKLPKCRECVEYTEKILAKHLVGLFLAAERTQKVVEAAEAVVASKVHENRGQGLYESSLGNVSSL